MNSKNKFFTIALLLLWLNCSFSQNGIVYYNYVDAIGIGNASGNDYNAYTMFSKDKSYYVTAKDSLETAINRASGAKHHQNEDGSRNGISNGLTLTDQGQQVVCDYSKKTMDSNMFDGKHVYVSEELPKFKWEIKKEKKKIGKFNCTLGVTYFRGRKFFAWYTSEIPVYSGPWKLNGLPGMILEAYDEGKNVVWSFKSYAFPVTNKQNYTIRKSIGEKKIKFLSISEFAQYCKEEIQRGYERVLILSKQHPGMKPLKEPMTSYYIESFEK